MVFERIEAPFGARTLDLCMYLGREPLVALCQLRGGHSYPYFLLHGYEEGPIVHYLYEIEFWEQL